MKRVLLISVVFVIIVSFISKLTYDTMRNAMRVREVLMAWELKGLDTSFVWLVREILADQEWLGPFQPKPPMDPPPGVWDSNSQ